MAKATKIKLGKLSASKRWRKKYKGVQYYLPMSKYPTREEAVAGWLALKTTIDAERQSQKPRRSEYEATIKARHDMATVARELGHNEVARLYLADAERLLQRFNQSDAPPPLSPLEQDIFALLREHVLDELYEGVPKAERTLPMFVVEEPIRKAVTIYEDRLQRLQAASADKSIHAQVARFLERKEAKAKGGEMSKGRWNTLCSHLKRWEAFLGPSFPTEKITATTLMDFHSRLTKQVTEGEIAKDYAVGIMTTVKAFVMWAYKLDLCGHPKNIDSKDLSFKQDIPEIRTFTADEVATLLAKASDRTKLYCLLGLNCGYTQADIASLRPDQVDWENGTITRKRKKTEEQKSTPTVCYPLWQTTFDLLKQIGSPTGDLVLTNAKGAPLKVEAIDGGTFHKNDNIRSAFARLLAKTDITGRTFKALRKTGASKLAEHSDHRHSRYLYLGHRPRSIADKHYSPPGQDLFAQAIRWLGKQFGIE